ncbi:hypothetical protein ACWERW_22830 [Streptomyces sp. NPDC004012]
MMTPHGGHVINAAVFVGRGTPVTEWGLLGPFFMGVLFAAVGLVIVSDY